MEKPRTETAASEHLGENWCANKRTQWNLDARTIAKVCAANNDRFNSDRFCAACGGLFDV